jgi:hypothetical protein
MHGPLNVKNHISVNSVPFNYSVIIIILAAIKQWYDSPLPYEIKGCFFSYFRKQKLLTNISTHLICFLYIQKPQTSKNLLFCQINSVFLSLFAL